jgi:hypothetical protein
MITLEIKEWVENPTYIAELKEWKAQSKYSSNFGDQPQKYTEVKTLIAKISDKQFEVIRKEILKEF